MVRRIDEAKSSTSDILNSIEANAKAILEKVKDMKSQKITTDDYNTSLLSKAKKEIIGVNSKLSNVSGYSAKNEQVATTEKITMNEDVYTDLSAIEAGSVDVEDFIHDALLYGFTESDIIDYLIDENDYDFEEANRLVDDVFSTIDWDRE